MRGDIGRALALLDARRRPIAVALHFGPRGVPAAVDTAQIGSMKVAVHVKAVAWGSKVGAMRILIVDDNPAIHADFAKILVVDDETGMDELEAALFGASEPVPAKRSYRVAFATQGEAAIELVRQAVADNDPFGVAFVDIRMPPGIDGIETTKRMWQLEPSLEVVLCSAYSDWDFSLMGATLGQGDQWLIIRKPFDIVEIERAAAALLAKRELRDAAKRERDRLEEAVAKRTAELVGQQQRQLQLEAELRHAQKLEAVGQLAAGVAHEINTPVQFVGDSVHFLREAFDGLGQVVAAGRRLVERCQSVPELVQDVLAFRRAETDSDIAFIELEVPEAFCRTTDGIQRVGTIVQAMRRFAHGGTASAPADLNNNVQDTLVVARNEYKLVADVELELGELPSVVCYSGDLNQVLLNLIVNAAHAVTERYAGTGTRGTIRIRTAAEADGVLIEVGDNGAGISPDHMARIFEPFFTTKPVGKGTGQGLAISHAIVVEKHQGSLQCRSVPNEGTTFSIRIPLEVAA